MKQLRKKSGAVKCGAFAFLGAVLLTGAGCSSRPAAETSAATPAAVATPADPAQTQIAEQYRKQAEAERQAVESRVRKDAPAVPKR